MNLGRVPQVEAGADVLQVFEAMGAFIGEDHFYDRAVPYLKRYAESRISDSVVGTAPLRRHPYPSVQAVEAQWSEVFDRLLVVAAFWKPFPVTCAGMNPAFYVLSFDTWIRIASELKERCPGVPLMVFARGATYANVALQVRCAFSLDASTEKHRVQT